MIKKICNFKEIRKNHRNHITTLEKVINEANVIAWNNNFVVNVGQDKIVAYAKDLDHKFKNWLLSVSDHESNFIEYISITAKIKRWIIKYFGYHRNIIVSKKNKNATSFYFDAVILLADKESVKFINFNNRKILSVVNYSFNKISLLQKVYYLYKDYYKTPINNVDISNKLISEDLMFDAKKMSFEITNDYAFKTIKQIFDKNLEIIKKQKNKKRYYSLNDLCENSYKKKYIETLFTLLNKTNLIFKCEHIMNLRLPFVLQHGDFLYQNFLVEDKEWFLLDFEHSNIFPFFYDFIFFIISPVWIKKWNNTDLIDLLINRELDFMINNLFLGIDYDNKKIIENNENLVLITLIARRMKLEEFYLFENAVRIAQSDFNFIANLYSKQLSKS